MKAMIHKGLVVLGLAMLLGGCIEAGGGPEPRWAGARMAAPEVVATERAPLQEGERVFVEWRGSYWPASVVSVEGAGRARITYEGFGPEWDEVAAAPRIKRELPHRNVIHPSERIFVRWKGSYWPARVKGTRPHGGVEISYEGFGSEWDEVVGLRRIKWLESERPELAARPQPLAVGDRIEVAWGNRYWPATVLALHEANLARIHYEGYGPEWDEVVGPDRIRPLQN
jgi:hypothetical protein